MHQPEIFFHSVKWCSKISQQASGLQMTEKDDDKSATSHGGWTHSGHEHFRQVSCTFCIFAYMSQNTMVHKCYVIPFHPALMSCLHHTIRV